MGRTLKRVPLDFNHPLRKTWDGYLIPDEISIPCVHCDRGSTNDYWAVHNYVLYKKEIPNNSNTELVKSIVSFYGKNKDIQLNFVRGIELYEVFDAITKGLNLPEYWYQCSSCNGTGIHPSVIKEYEAWLPTEPPLGKGYQLWETTSDGSPISPVFETLKSLCDWCESNVSIFADDKISASEWMIYLGNKNSLYRKGNSVFL